MPVRSRILSAIAIAATVALVAAGCGASSGGKGKVIEGGELRVGTGSGPDSLNPFVAVEQDAYTAFEYIYPTLVQYNKAQQFVPNFARSWAVSSDGKVWTFHTEPNAEWSDGKPLTAADAAWTFNTIMKFQNGATASDAGVIAHMTKASAPNATTLVVTYKKAVGNVLSQLQQIPILPEHIWAQYATGTGAALKTFQNAAPVVSGGPFMITKYQKNNITLFARNPKWWGQKPHVDGFGLQVYSDQDAETTALKNNAIDFMETVPPTAVAALQKAGFAVDESPGLEWHDFIINSNPHKMKNRELLNPLVRLAMDHAVDRNKIVSVAWLGYSQPGSSIIPPATPQWYDHSIKPTTFNLALANQELNQAGYKMGPNGVRIANGHPMSYTVIFAEDEVGAGDRAFAIIKADFAKIGIQLTQRVEDDATANATILDNGKYQTYDLAMWDWVPLIDPDFMLSVLTCAQYDGWSDSAYCNPTYDKLYAEQGEATNLAQRQKIVDQMQQMIYKDRPYLVLNYQDVLEAHSTHWTGFVPTPEGSLSPLSMDTMLSVHQVG